MQVSVIDSYENLVPLLSNHDYNALKTSIKENGLWVPIIINSQGVLLDGHHRYKACIETKTKINTITRDFESPLLEKKFVIECNLKRRQLNDFQKAELGVLLLPIEQELAKIRQANEGNPRDRPSCSNDQKGNARDLTASKVGMSGTTFERARKVIDKAPEKVKEQLRQGKTTISKEYKKIQKDEKRKIRQNQIKKIQVKLPETVTLYNQEFQSSPVKDNSVSLIFTDPPYHEKYLHLFGDLSKHAGRVLREGGSLITYVGHFNIGKVINMMESQGLKFHWPIAVIHSGPSASMWSQKVLVGYKLMLWFTKGKYEGEFVKDVIQSEFQGKELHEWAQSTKESDYYIKYLTIENEIVYDPFMGQGTFGISAVKQNRQFIGCEVEKEHFENAQRLISAAIQEDKN